MKSAPALFIESSGTGPPVVLLHGWALHGGIWDEVASMLSTRFTVRRVDLPGHGRSPLLGGLDSVDELADRLAGVAPNGAAWLGWSLGGCAALALATRRPDLVDRLVLVCATPSFVTRDGWRAGQSPATLEAFSKDLANDYRGAVFRFLALQVRGDARADAIQKDLRARVASRGMPTRAALHDGLALLQHIDLRQRARQVVAPTLIVRGGRDRLTHPDAGAWLAEEIPDTSLLTIEDAGHAPFLTHPAKFSAAVSSFLAGETQ